LYVELYCLFIIVHYNFGITLYLGEKENKMIF
jgi:hypothetical protein